MPTDPRLLLPAVQPTGHTWMTALTPADLLTRFQHHAPAFGVSGFRKLTWTEALPGLVTKKARTRATPSATAGEANSGHGFSPGIRVLGGSALYPTINDIEFAVYHALTRMGIPSVNVHHFLGDQRQHVGPLWEPLIAQYRGYWGLLRDRDMWLYAVGEVLWRNAWGLHARRPRPQDVLPLPAEVHADVGLAATAVRQGLLEDLCALREIIAIRHPMLEWDRVWGPLEAWLRVDPATVESWANPAGLSGDDFQAAVALLLQRAGFPDATVIGGPHDGGVDIQAPDPRTGTVWGIQTKLRTSGSVSASAVDEVIHGCRRRGAWQPWVIISSPHATETLRTACERQGVRLWTGQDLAQTAEGVAWSPRELLAIGRKPTSVPGTIAPSEALYGQ